MKAISFVGNSGSGKTRLIVRLILELKKRGHTVAVIKHCPYGFSMEPRRKDSRKFFEAGADGVALVSSQATAVIKRADRSADFSALTRSYFGDNDILLVEGGRAKGDFKKIEVLGKDNRYRPTFPAGEVVAIVSDHREEAGRPVFRHSQIKEIAGFLEGQPEWSAKARSSGGKRRKR